MIFPLYKFILSYTTFSKRFIFLPDKRLIFLIININLSKKVTKEE
ncbi:hypothetical protein CSG_710 [Campylobacter fetus subsp. venerealis str. 84-112]|nr:hypothetical protein CSG_710 [Campylobacter fetus subsp. venerealis str. 84-112]